MTGAVVPRPRSIAGAWWLPVCLAAAAVLGTMSGWKHGHPVAFTVASMQSVWALGACLTGALVGGRRSRSGALAGAMFGGVAIAAYYLHQAGAHGAHAAYRELTTAGGEFWITGALLGGALMGANGVVLTRWPTGRTLDPSAMAHAVLAGALASEAAIVLAFLPRFAFWGAAREVATGLFLLAAAIGLRALGRSGLRATVAAFGLAAACAPFAAGAFLLAERTFGYSTI
jgi:hypothetical protein